MAKDNKDNKDDKNKHAPLPPPVGVDDLDRALDSSDAEPPLPPPPPDHVGVPMASTRPSTPLTELQIHRITREVEESLGVRGQLFSFGPLYPGSPIRVEYRDGATVESAGVDCLCTEDQFRKALTDVVAAREKTKQARRDLADQPLQSAPHEVIPEAQDPSHPPVGGLPPRLEADRSGNPEPLDRDGVPLRVKEEQKSKGKVLPERPFG